MMTINLDATKLNTHSRRQVAMKVADELEYVLNSSEFERIFLENLYQRDYAEGELSHLKDFSPEEVFAHFMSGAEVLSPEIDREMDIEIDDYYSIKKVIGYTYPTTPVVYVNTKYFDKRSTKLIGSSICHEYFHKLGADHDFRRTSRRENSLSYIINDAYEAAYDVLYEIETKPKKTYCKRLWYTLFIKKKCWLA